MAFVSALVLAGKGYCLIGTVFAGWFAGRGAARLDPAAAGSTIGFRLLVVPGAVAIWPFLVVRLWNAAR